jgi:predicted O-methyltransferase YrrM
METLMFDFAAFYDRIAKELPNDCKVMEIGVANGDSALFLAQKLHDYGKKFKLYMVDSMDYGKYVQICTIYENIIKSGLGSNIEVVPFESLEASEKFNDGYFDFVYIDSSHEYHSTKKEIPAWYKKVKDEGILAGHDYNAPEVKQAVDETIPTYFTRTDIEGRIFDPEKVLHTENTNNGWGLWWMRKQWYISLNK